MAAIINIPEPMSRIIHLAKQVDQESINEVVSKIIEITEEDEKLKGMAGLFGMAYEPQPIKLFIDSYGGYVYQCMGLVNIMRSSKIPIHTIVTGVASSCGFVIAISGHKRFCYTLSSYLYHQVSSASGRKSIKQMDENLAEAKRLQSIIEQITLERTKISAKRLQKVYDTKLDWWFTADEAIKLGVVDEIL